jgi:hypothetical protein
MISLLLLLIIGWTVVLSLALLWTFSRLLRPDHEPSGTDPILGARDRVAVYCPSGLLIQPHPNVLVPMPDHLTTRGEMVAWMTKEMPKAVECRFRGAA